MDEQKLRELYNSLDKSGNGHIDKRDARIALETLLGCEVTHKQVHDFFSQMDTNGDGEIHYDEFRDWIKGRREEMFALFSALDRNGTGYFDHNDLLRVLEAEGYVINTKQTRVLLERMDMNNDGRICFADFEEFLHALPTLTAKDLFDLLSSELDLDNGDGISAPYFLAGGTRRSLQQVLAYCLSSITARSFTAPLERVKIIFQTQVERVSVVNLFSRIFKTEGLKGMFRGNGINAVKLVCEGFIRFTSYDRFVSLWSHLQERPLKPAEKLVAGSLAGLVTCGLTHPLETIRVRLATTTKINSTNGILGTTTALVKNEGFSALFRGLGPAMLAFIPYAAIDLAVFDILRTLYIEHSVDGEPTPLILLICGGSSATAGQTVTYPINLIRTKLQADCKVPHLRKYGGMVDCLKKVWVREGIGGLYRGFGINFIKSVPSIAISYAVAENIRKITHDLLLNRFSLLPKSS
eukprot:TRINITY_DN845_c0_g1_i1.p1 TRINITY_DN845_c0_g1~~TRINITY_DN845_c0_g1_i1.p1  ORF type:complete len:466 (+),score=48.87 TRINITY_DN845_c0_g1_i1:149-1546(+)